MINTSGITPVGVSILVLPDQIEEVTESGIITGTPQQKEKEQLAQTDGEVVAISEYAFHDEPHPRCKVGDRVIMAKYAGMVRQGLDGITYRLIKDNDVVAVLAKE